MKAEHDPGFFRRNGLSLVVVALMAFSMAGHAWSGLRFANEERAQHGLPAETLGEYLRSGEYWSSLLENWESEFLQMGLFVLLAAGLRQKGSAESRPFDPKQEEKKKEKFPLAEQPWPMRRGGVWKRLYENSLAITLLGLFALSFAGHLFSSWRQHVEEQQQHGVLAESLGEYATDSEFWFQSFQNWQSEYLAILSLILLSIFLRQKDSPQSKQMEAPHSYTGH
jgi:hypothetical protein